MFFISPIRHFRVLQARLLVLLCQLHYVFLIAALREHLIGLLLVEGTAHAAVGGVH